MKSTLSDDGRDAEGMLIDAEMTITTLQHACKTLGLTRMSDDLDFAWLKVRAARAVIKKAVSDEITLRFNNAQATSGAVLSASLAGAELATRSKDKENADD